MTSNRLIIFDTTLRDGEQSPGMSMNLEEKLLVAETLDAMGVDVQVLGEAVKDAGIAAHHVTEHLLLESRSPRGIHACDDRPDESRVRRRPFARAAGRQAGRLRPGGP